MTTLVEQTVALQNLGESGNSRWLNGDPNNGDVWLTELQYDANTGRNWEVIAAGQSDVVQLLSQGADGSDRYLYGDTSNGQVRLEVDGASTGTQWRIGTVSEHVFTLTSQGTGGSSNMLNGDPDNGAVNMASAPTSGGTSWNIFILL